jgi:hypothetical protein
MSNINISNSVSKLKKRDDAAERLNQERYNQVFEIQKSSVENHAKLILLENDYNNAKEKYLNSIENKKILVKKINSELNDLKLSMNNLVEDQKKYYLDILKKGIDTRRDGLNWVLKKLIELSTEMEVNYFPKFLNFNQVEFLMKIAYKQTESDQMKLIFNILKKNVKFKGNENLADSTENFNSYINMNNDEEYSNIGMKIKSNIISPVRKSERYKFIENGNFYKNSFSNKVLEIFDDFHSNEIKLGKSSQHYQIDNREVKYYYYYFYFCIYINLNINIFTLFIFIIIFKIILNFIIDI